jgi:hypothetical protein
MKIKMLVLVWVMLTVLLTVFDDCRIALKLFHGFHSLPGNGRRSLVSVKVDPGVGRDEGVKLFVFKFLHTKNTHTHIIKRRKRRSVP